MKNVYACLTGNWVKLQDDPECVMGENMVRPNLWYKETGDVSAPLIREKENCYYDLDTVKIFYLGKTYNINPVFIQIVEE